MEEEEDEPINKILSDEDGLCPEVSKRIDAAMCLIGVAQQNVKEARDKLAKLPADSKCRVSSLFSRGPAFQNRFP